MLNGVRLVGLAAPSDGANRGKLEELTGYVLIRDGDDWVIPSDDPALMRGPSDILKSIDKPWELRPELFSQIAEQYQKDFLVDYFEEKREEPKERMRIFGDYGERTKLEVHRLNFFFTPRNGIRRRLVEETFPQYVSEFKASSVAPLMVNASYQQALLSIAKILIYVKKGGQELATKRIQQADVLVSVLPTPAHLMSYVDALNTMCPSATALPLHRIGSSLHFMSGKPWFFPRLAVENVYEQFHGMQEPLADDEVAFFMNGKHFQRRAVQSYFVCSVLGVNRLARFLNDIRTYIDLNGAYDPLKMIKAHSVIRLLFADWTAMNFTQSSYVKLRLAFSFLDKMANFICFMRGDQLREEEIFQQLCSHSLGHQLSELLRQNFEDHYHSLGRLMSEAVTATYKKVHDHIAGKLGDQGKNEFPRLAYLRTVRNTSHGAFLKADQFEQVFLTSAGTLPGQFTYLPLLLLWGLVANPRKLIDMV